MPASAAQAQFAAEFALFLVALAGLALVVLRAHLLTPSPVGRTALAVGFASLGTAAFLHGSLVVDPASEGVVLGFRFLSVAALAGGALTWRSTKASRRLLWLGLVVLGATLPSSLDEPALGSSAVRTLGAVLLGAALLSASRRSIAARVAASAAATLLLVVMVLSVGLSAVLASSVEDQEVLRLDARARAESTAIDTVSREAIEKARLAAKALTARRDELLAVAEAPRASPLLDTDLTTFSDNFVSNLALAYITQDGSVIATSKLAPSTFLPISGAKVIREAIASRAERASVEAVGDLALAVGVSPVAAGVSGGTLRPLGVVVAAAVLDDSYLEVRARDASSLSLALVNRTSILARSGDQPPAHTVRRLAESVLVEEKGAVAVTDDRFVAARPVLAADGRPVVALVASTPTTVVNETREELFSTLFLIALGGTVLALLLASVVGDRIGAGLRQLTTAAEAIQRGHLGVRAGISSEDEVGVLGAAFDSMVASIEDQTAALQQAADDETRLRNRLEAIVAGMGEALVALDPEGRVTDFNRAAEVLFGVPAGEARGRPVAEILGAARAEDGTSLTARMNGGMSRPWSVLATVRRADGQDVPVAVSAGPLRGAGSENAGAVLVARDLRREREVERMKTEFLSRVGHELRTPLAPIMGFSKLLSSRDLPPQQAREHHQTIYSSSRQLLRIVEMLEFFASLEAGRQVLETQPVDVGGLVSGVVSAWAAKVDDGGRIRRRVGRGLPPVAADRRWLTMAIDELVDNAVKFSAGGGRIVVAAAKVREARGDEVEISVLDRGVGMSAAEVEKVFGAWVQADESDTRRYGGLGLGLALVKRVAEAHGGRVAVRTEAGKGAKFSIFLPALPT